MSRHFDDLDAVLEFDAFFRQLIFTLQSSPRFRSGIDKFEHQALTSLNTISLESSPTALRLVGKLPGPLKSPSQIGY